MRQILKRFAQVIFSSTNRLFLKSKQSSSSRKLVHLFLKPNGISFFFREPPRAVFFLKEHLNRCIPGFKFARSLNFWNGFGRLHLYIFIFLAVKGLLWKKNCTPVFPLAPSEPLRLKKFQKTLILAFEANHTAYQKQNCTFFEIFPPVLI